MWFAMQESEFQIASELAMHNITSDIQALDFAIKEGHTRNKAFTRAMDCLGLMNYLRVSEGFMEIHSGYASLRHYKKEAELIFGLRKFLS